MGRLPLKVFRCVKVNKYITLILNCYSGFFSFVADFELHPGVRSSSIVFSSHHYSNMGVR